MDAECRKSGAQIAPPPTPTSRSLIALQIFVFIAALRNSHARNTSATLHACA
jgi:hypothetical protein